MTRGMIECKLFGESRDALFRVDRSDTTLTLSTSGSHNIGAKEFGEIAAFVAGHPDAERFMEKLRARMERGKSGAA